MRRQAAVAIAAAVASVGVVSGGVAYGVTRITAPASDGRIYACYSTSSGTIHLANRAAACPAGQRALQWNQTGPRGPAGAAGARGAAGPPGPAGQPGGTIRTIDCKRSGPVPLTQGYTNAEDSTSLCPDAPTPEGMIWRQGATERLLGAFVSLDVVAAPGPCISPVDPEGGRTADGVAITVVFDETGAAGSRELDIPFGERRQIDIWIPFMPNPNLEPGAQPMPDGTAHDRTLNVTVRSLCGVEHGTLERGSAVLYTSTSA